MKKAILFRLLLLVVLAASLSGCRIVWTDPPAPTPTLTPTATSTLTPTPTDTPTPMPTDTPTQTPTPIPTQSIGAIANEFSPVLQEHGVEAAAEYDPSKPGIHKIIIITSVDQTDWNKSLPEAWRSVRVSETELVLVLQFNEVLLDYKGFTVRGYGRVYVGRFRTDTEAWLRNARTGDQIAYNLFVGQDPPPIPNRITSNTVLTGPSVSSEILQLWLKDFVEK
ncbi:MAG: hypothetical protein HY867_15980 [Chloroflexi bacterium]|nr:hypothetical protein [Chloroflexota bacterium]